MQQRSQPSRSGAGFAALAAARRLAGVVASVAIVAACGADRAPTGTVVVPPPVDTVRVPVDTPTAPPIPGVGTGQTPTDYTLVSQQDFATCVGDGWGNCTAATADADYELAQDASAPRSGGTVLRNWFRAGFAGGHASMPPMERFLPAGQRRLYGAIWFKLSPNFEGHLSGVNKLGYVWMHGGAIVYFSAQGPGSNPLEMQIRLQGVGAGPSAQNLRPNMGRTGAVTRGAWHRFEYVLLANTPGQTNGTARFWLDGHEVGRYTNLGFAGATQSDTWEMVSVFPHWGGVSGSVQQDMWMAFDHYLVATAP